MKVLGIDVGLRSCGYVFCQVEGLNIKLIKEGQIKPKSSLSFSERLGYIFKELTREVIKYSPRAIVVEKLYSHYRHPLTLGILAQVRGIIALLAYQRKIEFLEYASTRARKSFIGKGSATSEQVKKMAENLTGKKFISLHTADAFSLVVALSHDQKVKRILKDSFN